MLSKKVEYFMIKSVQKVFKNQDFILDDLIMAFPVAEL